MTMTEIKPFLHPGQRLLGLDIGTKTIGIAVCDPRLKVATPVCTITRTKWKNDLEQLKQLMSEKNIGALVLGLPINMNGTEGPKCQSVRQFGRNIQADTDLKDIKITFWDERLSSVAVERMMIEEADLSRKKRAKSINHMAAAYILQGLLDSA